MRYNLWTVVDYNFLEDRKVLCLCDCGTERAVRLRSLTSGVSKSCGCIKITHGEGWNKTKEYRAWQHLKDRCLNKNDKAYPRYGGRGIGVCDRWLSSFENFLKDMGRSPTVKHSIDRINNDGNYEPENCRWATASQQNKNRRKFKIGVPRG